MKGSCVFWFILCLASIPWSRQRVHPDFEEYVQRFERLRGQDIESTIIYGTPDRTANPNAVANCFLTGNRPLIKVDFAYFQTLGDLGKEELIFHELGHCELKRDHDEEMIGNRPKSIMYPTTFGDTPAYQEFHEEYIKELLDL